MKLGAVLAGECQVGQHGLFRPVPEGTEVWPSRQELVRNVPAGLVGLRMFRLKEDLPDGARDRRRLSLENVGKGVPHEVDPAALQSRAGDAGARRLQAPRGRRR